MNKIFCLAVLIIFAGNFFANLSHAEIKTYTGVGDYILSEDTPPGDIKSKAKMYAQKNALEQAGVFVSGLTEVKNNIVSKDEIITIVGGILKIIDTKFEIIPLNDAAGIAKYRATVTAQIDTNLLDAAIKNWLNRDANEKANLVQQNKSQQETIANLQKKIAELEKQAAAVKTTQDRQNVQENFAGIDRETLATQKFEESKNLYEKKDFQRAIFKLNEAIELNPNFSKAYNARGFLYNNLKNYNQAIQEFNQAIILNPNFDWAYNNRGLSYAHLKNYTRAISDFNQAIKINPNDEETYYNRGLTYYYLKNYSQAIADYNQAINLNPNNADAYNNRGWTYFNLKNYTQALKDSNKAIELDKNNAYAYDTRGNAYKALGRNEEAEADLAKARELGYNG